MYGLYSDQKSSKGKFLLKFILFSKKYTHTHAYTHTLHSSIMKVKKIIKFIFNAMSISTHAHDLCRPPVEVSGANIMSFLSLLR